MKRLLYPSLLIGFVLVYYYRVLALQVFMLAPGRHALLEYYSMLALALDQLKQLQWPLWNPYVHSGFPLLAEGQTGIFYPVKLPLFFLLPYYIAYHYNVVLHVALSGLFMYAFARLLKLERPSALFIALVYTFTDTIGFGVHPSLNAITWQPLLFWCTERLLQTNRWRYAVIGGIVLGLQLLAGFAQATFWSLVGISIYAIFRLITSRNLVPSLCSGQALERGEGAQHATRNTFYVLRFTFYAFRPLAGLLLIVFIGFGLAAVQLLPVYEASRLAFRLDELGPAFALDQSMWPTGVATFLTPAWGILAGTGEQASGYMGLLPFVLAVAAAIGLRRDRSVQAFAVLALLALVLTMGKYTPVYSLLLHLPGFDLFRIPARWMHLAKFALVVLAGFGFQALLTEAREGAKEKPVFSEKTGFCRVTVWRLSARILAAITAVMAVGVVLGNAVLYLGEDRLLAFGMEYAQSRVYGTTYHVQSQEYYQQRIAGIFREAQQAVDPRNSQVLGALVVGMIGVGLLALGSRRAREDGGAADIPSTRAPVPSLRSGLRLPRTFVLGAVWILIVGDILFLYRGGLVTGMDRVTQEGILSPPPTMQVLTSGAAQPRMYKVLTEAEIARGAEAIQGLPADFNILFRVPSVGVVTPLVTERYYRLIGSLDSVELGFGSRPPTDADIAEGLPVLNLLNAQYVLSPRPLRDERLRLVGNTGEVLIYENTTVLPRAFVVPGYLLATSEDDALARVRSADFDPLSTVILEEEPRISSSQHSAVSGQRSAEIVEYGDACVVIDAVGPGWLVLADTYYPGWKVFVDGVEERIYRADYVLRAVPLGAGLHQVEFSYLPSSFHLGLVVTITVLLGIIMACALYILLRMPVREENRS